MPLAASATADAPGAADLATTTFSRDGPAHVDSQRQRQRTPDLRRPTLSGHVSQVEGASVCCAAMGSWCSNPQSGDYYLDVEELEE